MLTAFRFIINKYDIVIIHLLLLLRQRKNPIPKILRGSDNDVSFVLAYLLYKYVHITSSTLVLTIVILDAWWLWHIHLRSSETSEQGANQGADTNQRDGGTGKAVFNHPPVRSLLLLCLFLSSQDVITQFQHATDSVHKFVHL